MTQLPLAFSPSDRPAAGVFGSLQRVLRGLRRFARRKPMGAFGAVVIVALLFLAVFGSALAPYDAAESVARPLQGPSASHPFGTDWIGRDTLSRVMAGARTSFFTATLVVLFAGVLGLFFGTTTAYLRGTYDLAVLRVVESFQAIPLLIFAVSVVAVFGPQVWKGIPLSLVVAMGIAFTPVNARVIRASALMVMTQSFMEAAESVGAGHARRIVTHLIPNLMAPVIVLASIQLGSAVVVEASLGFVGVSVPPPTPTWGGLLGGDTRTHMRLHPELVIFPGAVLSLFVISINFLGDALRDMLDPRLRGAGGS